MNPRVSFVIPVRNDARRLAACLTSIRRVFAAAGRVEVVVIDNASVDGSGDVARRMGATVVTMEGGRVSELRNRGARIATGDILAFVDADHEIGAGWVTAALDSLRLPGVGATGALCRPPLDGTWVQRAYGHLRGKPRGRHDVEWLGSGNLAIWRHVFERLGGFDTSLEACEDVELCGRIRSAGFRIVSDARLDNVHHGDPPTLRDLFRSELWRGRDNLRVSLRPPLTWRGLPSALLPVLDLAVLAAAALAAVGMVAGVSGSAVIAVACAAVVAAGAAAKVLRARLRGDATSPGSLVQTFIVALVYDSARSIALLARAPHRRAAPADAPATS